MAPIPILIVGSSGAALLALGAGILNGSFATPTRFMNRWRWENVWALWAVFAMFILPWIIAFATVPHLLAIYQTADVSRALLLVIAFGAGYGIAAICFGLGVEAIGIALNFAIALGTATAVGSAIPLFWFHSSSVFTRQGLTIETGIILVMRNRRAFERANSSRAIGPNRSSAFLKFWQRPGFGFSCWRRFCIAKFRTCLWRAAASPRRRTGY